MNRNDKFNINVKKQVKGIIKRKRTESNQTASKVSTARIYNVGVGGNFQTYDSGNQNTI